MWCVCYGFDSLKSLLPPFSFPKKKDIWNEYLLQVATVFFKCSLHFHSLTIRVRRKKKVLGLNLSFLLSIFYRSNEMSTLCMSAGSKRLCSGYR